MSKETFRRLRAAIGDFSALSGRPVRSRLLNRTLREGEYKSSMEPALGAHGEPDPLEIPKFLKRTSETEPEENRAVVDGILTKADQARKSGKGKPSKTSEQVLTRDAVIEAINQIQDAGYLRSRTQQSSKRNVYEFVHHSKPGLKVVVDRLGEGFRLSGADTFLAEFDVAPGGPMQTDTLAMGQADGDDPGMSADIQSALEEAFSGADYRVQLSVFPISNGRVSVVARPVIGKMKQYDDEELQGMIESIITSTMKRSFPKLKMESARPGVSGWIGEGGMTLRLIYLGGITEEHEGFDKLKGELSHEKGVKDPGAVAAAIGRKKYGKKAMAAGAKQHHAVHQADDMDEHLGADADTKDYIDDFEKSDAPQFKGKSKAKRRQMAIAASYKGK
jgi:hypothetical protein